MLCVEMIYAWRVLSVTDANFCPCDENLDGRRYPRFEILEWQDERAWMGMNEAERRNRVIRIHLSVSPDGDVSLACLLLHAPPCTCRSRVLHGDPDSSRSIHS
jgi:hypothetical protein